MAQAFQPAQFFGAAWKGCATDIKFVDIGPHSRGIFFTTSLDAGFFQRFNLD